MEVSGEETESLDSETRLAKGSEDRSAIGASHGKGDRTVGQSIKKTGRPRPERGR